MILIYAVWRMRSLIKRVPDFFANDTSFVVHIFVFTFKIAADLADIIYGVKYSTALTEL